MNPPENQKPHNGTLKIQTAHLVLMALFASLGLATKNIIHPLLAPLTGSLYIPTGAVSGGLYMMWPVMVYGLIRKPGTATMVSLIQAFISLIVPYGNFGILGFIIYLVPGLAIDSVLLLSRHKACCLICCVFTAAIANTVGTILVGALVLALPLIVLAFLAVLAAISGCIGGFIASLVLVRVTKSGVWRTKN